MCYFWNWLVGHHVGHPKKISAKLRRTKTAIVSLFCCRCRSLATVISVEYLYLVCQMWHQGILAHCLFWDVWCESSSSRHSNYRVILESSLIIRLSQITGCGMALSSGTECVCVTDWHCMTTFPIMHWLWIVLWHREEDLDDGEVFPFTIIPKPAAINFTTTAG